MIGQYDLYHNINWRQKETIARICSGFNGYRCKKINTAKRDQILDEFFSISHNINTQGNGVNSTILPPAIDTRVSLTLV